MLPAAASVRVELVRRLRSAGCVYAEDEADLLLRAGRDLAQLEDFTRRRIAGQPLELVVGFAEFCGLRVVVDAGVFVPRRRSEFLVDVAVRLVSERVSERTDPVVLLDLCCGTGALAAAVSARLVSAGAGDRGGPVEVHAADIDPVATCCARRNLAPEAAVYDGDLFQPLPLSLAGRVDLLLANAPYVPHDEIDLLPAEARCYEHPVALDGGSDGLDLHRRIAALAPRWLAPGGHLLIETSRRQRAAACAIMAAAGLRARVHQSEEFDAVVVTGRSEDLRRG